MPILHQLMYENIRHIRDCHCAKEGGSFVCRYGYNGVCSSLPLEGVSDQDYEDHVLKHHAFTMLNKGSSGVISKAQTRAREEKWGVFSSTQNVPSVLNDPRKGIRRDFFTKTWGESFVEVKEIPAHVALPQVTIKHVESYVRRLRKRQKLLSRLASMQAGKAQEAAEESSLEPSPRGKLFHYLETVEVDMSRQIARKSSAFFDTMTYLNAQMEQLKLNHEAVSTLRRGITTLRREAVVEPIKILALPRRRDNITATCKKLEVMSAVREVQSTIQVMLARQEFTAALDLISTTQDLLHTELSTIRSLKHLSSELTEHEKLIDKMVSADFTKYITEDLNRPLEDTQPLLEEAVVEAVSKVEIDQEIASVADQARVLTISAWLSLLSVVTSRLNTVIARVKGITEVMVQTVEAGAGRTQPVTEGIQAASLVTMPLWPECVLQRDFEGFEESEEEAVVHEIVALGNSMGLEVDDDDVEELVEEHSKELSTEELLELHKEENETLKRSLTSEESGEEEDKEESRIIPAKDLKDAFFCWSKLPKLAEDYHPDVGSVQKAISVFNDNVMNYFWKIHIFLLFVDRSSSDGEAVLGEVACGRVLGGLREILCATCDYAHDRCAKLLHARSREHGLDKMTANEFLTLSRIIEDFVADTESVCGRKSTSFRMGLQGQATRFVLRFHEEREARYKLNMNNERWKAVHAPPDLQRLLDHISATGV
ncbi:Vacuolar protein sorting-associated protein 54-like 1 [Homarus americanus]|uniref:Vacuolar protein sorting-associated protein 54-like 1 n=1 Tax=Homarus americanus TaxID=6706 RepID=A0A8J5NE11_HOMAM|nr:Vacuolar protein sorting-associated protein 54-like 1 [Homarus americanus]